MFVPLADHGLLEDHEFGDDGEDGADDEFDMEELSEEMLHDLAREQGLDPDAYPNKTTLVKAILDTAPDDDEGEG